MLRKLITAGLIFSGCWLSGQAEANSLTVYTEHFPPYNYLQDQELVGINTELVQAICHKTAIQCEFKLYPWLRAYENARRDSTGALFSTSRHPQREEEFQWVGPLMYSTAYLYRLRSRQAINPANLEEAKQFVVGVAHGDVYEIYLKSIGFDYGKNLVGFVSKADSVGPFLQQKVDLIIGSPNVLQAWLQHYDKDISELEAVLEFDMLGLNYLALNPDVDPELVSQMQQALDELKSSGEAERILQQYLSELPTQH
ncbi:MAG: transporter substrate-binding domain-containing protein [Alkalimonas sp.]|nr:transporter substrate-binding domain-containing protein [Alkalimonas sp.]